MASKKIGRKYYILAERKGETIQISQTYHSLDKLKLNLKLNKTYYSKLGLNFDESLHEYIYSE